jgi:hypothetical protein
MKKRVLVVEHQHGYFLAVEGDLSNRLVEHTDKFKPFEDVDKWLVKVLNKKTGYSSYDVNELGLYETELDLRSYPNDIDKVDYWYDPGIVNAESGLVNPEAYHKMKELTNRNLRIAQKEVDAILAPPPVKIENKSNNNKSLKTIMETAQVNLEEQAFNKVWDEAIQANIEDTKHKHLFIQEIERLKRIQEHKVNKAKDVAPSQEATQNNESINTKNMNTNQEASADATTRRTPVRRARRGLAKVTETGIVITTDLVIGLGMLTSDLIYIGCEGLAWGQAAAIKPLGLHPDATRAELKEACIKRAENRSSAVIAVPQMVIALPKRGIASIKQAMSMRNDKGIIDIQNAEVVA